MDAATRIRYVALNEGGATALAVYLLRRDDLAGNAGAVGPAAADLADRLGVLLAAVYRAADRIADVDGAAAGELRRAAAVVDAQRDAAAGLAAWALMVATGPELERVAAAVRASEGPPLPRLRSP